MKLSNFPNTLQPLTGRATFKSRAVWLQSYTTSYTLPLKEEKYKKWQELPSQQKSFSCQACPKLLLSSKHHNSRINVLDDSLTFILLILSSKCCTDVSLQKSSLCPRPHSDLRVTHKGGVEARWKRIGQEMRHNSPFLLPPSPVFKPVLFRRSSNSHCQGALSFLFTAILPHSKPHLIPVLWPGNSCIPLVLQVYLKKKWSHSKHRSYYFKELKQNRLCILFYPWQALTPRAVDKSPDTWTATVGGHGEWVGQGQLAWLRSRLPLSWHSYDSPIWIKTTKKLPNGWQEIEIQQQQTS